MPVNGFSDVSDFSDLDGFNLDAFEGRIPKKDKRKRDEVTSLLVNKKVEMGGPSGSGLFGRVDKWGEGGSETSGSSSPSNSASTNSGKAPIQGEFPSPHGSPVRESQAIMPKTPFVRRVTSSRKLGLACIDHAKDTLQKLSECLNQKTTVEIQVSKEETIRFKDLKLIGGGDFNDAYRVTTDSSETLVLKTLKDSWVGNEGEILNILTGQFMRYCQSRNEENMRPFIPIYRNFEPYYQQLSNEGIFLVERANEQLYKVLKRRIETDMEYGVIVMPYVSEKFFPREFDKEDPKWQSLKDLFALCHSTRICHDLGPENIHLEGDQVKLIDLYEVDPEDNFEQYENKYMDAYGILSDNHEARNWLCPWRSKAT